MRLNRLRVTNFRQHVDTQIDFDLGIIGIIGPNGSGKTTLLEAIAWALYGMPAARTKRESIRSTRAAPGAPVRVELDFDLGGHRYVVSRGLTTADLFLDGSAVPIATSTSAVSDLIERRLGMSRDEFFNTYFTGQKELGRMAAMGPTDRGRFLSRVLGYERLRTAQDMVRARRSALDAEMRGLRAGMPDPEVVRRSRAEAAARLASADADVAAAIARRERARAARDDATPRWEQQQRARENDQRIDAELRVARSDRDARQRESDRIREELGAIVAARTELETLVRELAPLSALELELRELERASSEQAHHRTLTESLRVGNDELSALIDRRGKIESAPAVEATASEELARARTEADETQAQFESAQTEWVRDQQEAETKRRDLLDQLRDVQHQRDQIVELGENGTCPICARPLGTHFRSVLDEFDRQVESITAHGRYYRARIDQLAAMPPAVAALDERRRQLPEQVTRLERRVAKAQAAVLEMANVIRDIEARERRRDELELELRSIAVAYDEPRHTDVRAAVERLAPLAARRARVETQLEREPSLVEGRDRVGAELAGIDVRLAGLEAQRHTLGFSEDAFAGMRDTFDRALVECQAAELAAAAVEAEVVASRKALETAEEAIRNLERAEARLAELSSDRRLHDELDRAFGDIRTDLNQELRPELSDRASRYLRDLTDGRYAELELDEHYNIVVLEDAIPKPVISGGEEDLANLVLRLAISEMIAERAGQPFSLLILDEVFGSLDEARRHNVVDLLRRLQDRFEQVVLITHIESVREGLDRLVTVRYDEESGTSAVDTDSLATIPAGPLFAVGATA